MRAVLGDVDATLRGQTRDAKCREKAMQQSGVVGVPHILEIELPIVVQDLRGGAEDFWLAVQYPVDAGADQIADVIRQRRRLQRQRAKDEVAKGVDAQFLEPMLFQAEARRHPALAGDPAAEGDAVEITSEI